MANIHGPGAPPVRFQMPNASPKPAQEEAAKKAPGVESTLIENLNDAPLFIPVRAGTVTFSPMSMISDKSFSPMKDVKPLTLDVKSDGHVAIHINKDGKLEVKLLDPAQAEGFGLERNSYHSNNKNISITPLKDNKKGPKTVELKNLKELDGAILTNLWKGSNSISIPPSLREKPKENRLKDIEPPPPEGANEAAAVEGVGKDDKVDINLEIGEDSGSPNKKPLDPPALNEANPT